MTLESLQARLADVEKAIAETNQRGLMLIGHKNEIEFQIGELKKAEEAESAPQPESSVPPEETLPPA